MTIIGKDILKASKAIFLFRSVYKKYQFLEERLDEVYKNSKLYTRIKSVFDKIGIIFQHSFLGRITEVGQEVNSKEALEGSKFVKWVLEAFSSSRFLKMCKS